MAGLWIGEKQAGRVNALAVGVFGLVVAAVGVLLGYPIVMLGLAIALGAALWSAVTSPKH